MEQIHNIPVESGENIYVVPKKLTKPDLLIVNTKEFKDA
jgi:hypothetical protein